MEYYIIRKYENRKFYDSNTSKVMTLSSLADLSDMDNLLILDHNDKDITTESLLLGVTNLFKRRKRLGKINRKEQTIILGLAQRIGEVLQ